MPAWYRYFVAFCQVPIIVYCISTFTFIANLGVTSGETRLWWAALTSVAVLSATCTAWLVMPSHNRKVRKPGETKTAGPRLAAA